MFAESLAVPVIAGAVKPIDFSSSIAAPVLEEVLNVPLVLRANDEGAASMLLVFLDSVAARDTLLEDNDIFSGVSVSVELPTMLSIFSLEVTLVVVLSISTVGVVTSNSVPLIAVFELPKVIFSFVLFNSTEDAFKAKELLSLDLYTDVGAV